MINIKASNLLARRPQLSHPCYKTVKRKRLLSIRSRSQILICMQSGFYSMKAYSVWCISTQTDSKDVNIHIHLINIWLLFHTTNLLSKGDEERLLWLIGLWKNWQALLQETFNSCHILDQCFAGLQGQFSTLWIFETNSTSGSIIFTP